MLIVFGAAPQRLHLTPQSERFNRAKSVQPHEGQEPILKPSSDGLSNLDAALSLFAIVVLKSPPNVLFPYEISRPAV